MAASADDQLVSWVKGLEWVSRKSPASIDRNEIFALLEEPSWVIRMLLCRMISRINWTTHEAESLVEFIRNQSADSNAFVRAWALDAFVALALKLPSLASEVSERILEAVAHETPAVAARAKKLRSIAIKPQVLPRALT